MARVEVFLTLVITGPLAAAVINVDDDGPAEFSAIKPAVETARSGDTILVQPGIYTGAENRDINFSGKALVLRSAKGPETTVIDCGQQAHGIYIVDNMRGQTVLEGLTIRNAIHGAVKIYNSNPPHSPSRRSRYSPGFDPVIIRDCVISDNRDGGILLDGHDNVRIERCRIIANQSGVYAYKSGPCFVNCVIAENDHNGLYATWPELINCTVARNGSTGVILSEGEIINSIVCNNTYSQIRNSTGSAKVTYCNVSGGWLGEGNMDVDPCFADPVAGDYHLKSLAGRWSPVTLKWVQDAVSSPCIDAGSQVAPVGPEPFPNGARINMGAHGGTAEASKTWFRGGQCRTIIAGDINGDCRVDFEDVSILCGNWMTQLPVENLAPRVSVVSPQNGQTIGRYEPDDPIMITADANDPDGTVMKVRFYIDGSESGEYIGMIEEDTDASDEWSANWIWWGAWGHYAEGWYTITARATDDDGRSRTSEPVRVRIHGPK